jgi:hypothetical protein
MAYVNPKRIHIRWAWVPAAVVVIALSWHRRGAVVTILLVLGGLALGYYVNRRARRRGGPGAVD